MAKPLDHTAGMDKIPVGEEEAAGILDGIREGLTNGKAEEIKDQALRKRLEDKGRSEDLPSLPEGSE